MIRIIISFTLFYWVTFQLNGQVISADSLQNGDLLFQDLDCELCEAIEQVTTSYFDNHFSHIGLVWIDDNEPKIIEAIGKEVVVTPLSVFVNRSANSVYVGRLKKTDIHIIPKAVEFARKQLGVPYDDAFLYSNGKYYCSELIYDAFRFANNDNAIFDLEPMTFKVQGKEEFSPIWVAYYQKLGIPIPENALGINPGGISRSDKLQMFLYIQK